MKMYFAFAVAVITLFATASSFAEGSRNPNYDGDPFAQTEEGKLFVEGDVCLSFGGKIEAQKVYNVCVGGFYDQALTTELKYQPKNLCSFQAPLLKEAVKKATDPNSGVSINDTRLLALVNHAMKSCTEESLAVYKNINKMAKLANNACDTMNSQNSDLAHAMCKVKALDLISTLMGL